MAAMMRASQLLATSTMARLCDLYRAKAGFLIGVYRLLCDCLPGPNGNMLCRKRTERLDGRRQSRKVVGYTPPDDKHAYPCLCNILLVPHRSD
jgi:hypothetical protein